MTEYTDGRSDALTTYLALRREQATTKDWSQLKSINQQITNTENSDWYRNGNILDYNSVRAQALQNCQSSLQQVIQNNQCNAIRQQKKHDELRCAQLQLMANQIAYLRDKYQNDNMKKVYEYVAYYAPTAEELKANPEIAEAIILSDKLIADSEQTVRTKVTRLIPDTYDAVIDKVKIEIRSFR